jgi:hypothetical protein
MQKWTQAEAVAFECAREVITDLRAILTGQIADESSKEHPDAERVDTLRAERSRLFRERAGLHVKDHAEIARIRRDYGRRIRYHRMDETQARAHLDTLGLSFAIEGAQIDSADTWRELGRLAFEAVECVTFDRPANDGSWLLIGEHLGQTDAVGWMAQIAVQQPYWIRKADLAQLQEIESYLSTQVEHQAASAGD